MRFLFIVFLLAFPISANAIEADQTRVKEYELVTITHEPGEVIYATFNYVNGDGIVERRVLPEASYSRGETKTSFTGPPADYEVTTGKPLFVQIAREGSPKPSPKPQPNPSPDPIPGPSPEPDSDKIDVKRVFFIEEQNDRNINPQYIAFSNADFQRKLRDKGVKVYTFDDDDPNKNVQDWANLVREKMPAAVFYDDDTKDYRIEQLPADITADTLYKMFERIAK